jgi:hypothetical protein
VSEDRLAGSIQIEGHAPVRDLCVHFSSSLGLLVRRGGNTENGPCFEFFKFGTRALPTLLSDFVDGEERCVECDGFDRVDECRGYAAHDAGPASRPIRELRIRIGRDGAATRFELAGSTHSVDPKSCAWGPNHDMAPWTFRIEFLLPDALVPRVTFAPRRYPSAPDDVRDALLAAGTFRAVGVERARGAVDQVEIALRQRDVDAPPRA